MRRAVLIAAISVVAGAAGIGAEAGSRYVDGTYGFSLSAPRYPKAGPGTSVIPVMLLAPAEGGFSNNVNVAVQNRPTTLDAYLAQARAEFKVAGLAMTSERRTKVSGADAALIEYEGTMQGRALKWLALVVVTRDRVYLVTCTATKATFPRYEKAFRACLSSFRLAK